MSALRVPLLRRSLVTLASVAGASLVRFALDPLVHDKGVFTFFEGAVVIAAYQGGVGSGIAATLLSVPICDYFFIEPRYTWFLQDAPADSIMLAAFLALGLALSYVIGQWKKAREDLKTSIAALQESELKLRSLAATAPGILFTATLDGRIDYLSDTFRKYTGMPAHIPDSRWTDAIHPEDRPRLLRVWSECLREERTIDMSYRLRGADGEYRWFQGYAEPVRDSAGNVVKWSGLSMDVEEHKRLEEMLERRGQELRESSEDFQKFAYQVGHDLREPLRAVGIYTELLSFQERSKEERAVFARQILDGVKRIRRQLDQLVEYARSGNYQPDRQSVDLEALLKTVLTNLRPAIEETGAAITHGPLPEVVVDRDLFLSVFQNLIGNALKYRSASPPRIHISCVQGKREWLFRMQDNGIGFEPQYAERIFGAFERLRNDVEGAGLGLAIVRRIIERRGGRIWAESKPGEGSIFHFTIPNDFPIARKAHATGA
jgi:PAS domain S-box-containing protein